MPELDVDAYIKNFRQKNEEADVIEEHFLTWEYEKYGGSRTEFYNPNDNHPMRLALYLNFMDVTPLEDAMKPYYRRLKSVKYLASMGRTMIFMKIKEMTPDGMANHLITHPVDAELLGYEKNEELNQSRKELENKNNELNTTKTELEKQLQLQKEYENRIKDLEIKNKEQKNQEVQITQLQTELKQTQEQLEARTKEIELMKPALEKKNKEVNEKKAELERIKQALETQKIELKELRDNQSALKEKNFNVERIQDELEKTQNDLKEKNKEIKQLQNKLEVRDNIIEEMKTLLIERKIMPLAEDDEKTDQLQYHELKMVIEKILQED